jgi:hypothetical protein
LRSCISGLDKNAGETRVRSINSAKNGFQKRPDLMYHEGRESFFATVLRTRVLAFLSQPKFSLELSF